MGLPNFLYFLESVQRVESLQLQNNRTVSQFPPIFKWLVVCLLYKWMMFYRMLANGLNFEQFDELSDICNI